MSNHVTHKTVQAGQESRGWWREHGIDVFVAILTIIGLWIGYKIPVSLNERDSADRLSSERTARFEGDVGIVNQLVASVLGEEGVEHVVSKRAAARAIAEYAQQGRIYEPSTAILLHYLEKEKDPKTHCYLHAAIDRGLNVDPPALGTGAKSSDGKALDLASFESAKKAERALLKDHTEQTDITDCSSTAEPTAPPTTPPLQPRISEYRQYLDVDCARTNSNPNLFVPIDSSLSAQYTVQSAMASIQDSSNIKDVNVNVVGTQPNGAIVQYGFNGLDRQLFGNCPGGGHGTLVVRFQLIPK
jgi:hypothetical protein